MERRLKTTHTAHMITVQGTIWLLCALASGLTAVNAKGSGLDDYTTPRFQVPAACELGRHCWVVQYVDHDPSADAADYACGVRTYDGHTGTDFGVRDLTAVRQGVAVVASAPGMVRATRDGMADEIFEPKRADQIRSRECGNGVVIDHGEGWETQYCHLRQGSVAVQPGDNVEAGEVIGQIGLSGRTQFPHLEFVLRLHGEFIDPFTGPEPGPGCSAQPGNLWDDDARDRLAYSPVDIYHAGIAAGVPSEDDVRAGRLNDVVLAATAPALVAWVEIFGARRGDRLVMRVIGPDESTIAHNESVLEKDQIRVFRYLGKRRRGDRWTPGTYRAEITLTRQKGVTVVRAARPSVEVQ